MMQPLRSYQEWKGRAQKWSVLDGNCVKTTFVVWDTLLKPSSYMPDMQWPEFECVKLVDSWKLVVSWKPLSSLNGGVEFRVLHVVGPWCFWARIWLYSSGCPQIHLSFYLPSTGVPGMCQQARLHSVFSWVCLFIFLDLGSHSSDWV